MGGLSSFGPVYELLAQYARLAFGGMLLLVIVYQLWLARARPGEPLLYLVAAWAGAALCMVIGRSVQHATDVPSTVLLGVRIFHTGVFALVPLSFAMAHEIRRVPRGRLFWFLIAGTSLPIPLAWVSTLIISDRVQEFSTLSGSILGPVPAAAAPLGIPYLIFIAAYLAWVAWKGDRGIPWQTRLPLNVGFALLLPALVNDVLLYSGHLVTLEIMNVALFVQVVVMNAAIMSRTGGAFAGLEETVAQRTAALLERERGLTRALETRRQILDAIPDVLCILHEGRMEYVNAAAERFFGRARTELVGQRLVDQVVDGRRHHAEAELDRIGASAVPTSPVELLFANADGAPRAAEVAGLTLELDAGARTLVTLRDVTERRHLLAKLQVADRLASVGTLAAGVAHEINNPLAFVSINLGLIRRALATTGSADRSAQLESFLDDCMTGTERIAQIVRDLTVFTRAKAERTDVDCRDSLEYALRIAEGTIGRQCEIERDFGALPLVHADPRRLSQVFLNLLVNAFQAIPADDVDARVRVATRTRADGWAVVEVSDSGVGIDPALVRSVFDPFFTTKAAGSGTGLGLFICQGIVTELGGEIRISPRSPRGTTFEVVLPPSSAAAPTVAAPAAHAKRAVGAGHRVLIADDEPALLRGLERLLARHQVTAVANGDDAIAAIESEPFDAIICDLMMPGCTGVEVFERARALGYGDRFVLMTGGATTEAHRAFVEGGHLRSIAKPATASEIEAAIEDCVRASSPRRADGPART